MTSLLHVKVALGSGVPIYKQIVYQICYAIAAGGLKEGEELPTVSVLAESLVVNPNTILRAYRELLDRKIVTAETSGFLAVVKPTRELKIEVLQPYIDELARHIEALYQ